MAKARKRFAKLRLPVLLLICGAAIFFAPQIFVKQRFSNQIYASVEAVPPREFAVVFGARVYDDGKLSDAARERIAAAVLLHKAGKARKLFVSGDNRNNREAEAIAAFAVENGVPENDVLIDKLGIDTKDTCRNFARIGNAAIVVTQGYHLPRTLHLCEQLKVEAVGLAAEGLGLLESRGNSLIGIYAIRFSRTIREAALIWSNLLGLYDYYSDEAEKSAS